MHFISEDHKELIKVASQHEEWYELIKQKNAFITEEKDEIQKKYMEIQTKIEHVLKELENMTRNFQESKEVLQTVQFENEENILKLEKYEFIIREHQAALTDNECFIKELNDQVYDLQKKITSYEEAENKENTNVEVEDFNSKTKEDLHRAELRVKEYGLKIERLEKQLSCYENTFNSMKAERTLEKYEEKMTPNKLVLKSAHTSKKFDSFSTNSPLSPITKNKHQEIIQNLEKRLAEATKALEKKTANLVQKTNKIQQLEKETSKELIIELEKLKCDKIELQKQLDELRTKYSEVLISNEELKKNCLVFQSNISNMSEDLIASELKLNTTLEELFVERTKYAKSVEDCQSTETELLNVKKELCLIQDKLKDYEMIIIEHKEKSLMLNEKLSDVESLLQSKEKEILKLQDLNEEANILVQVLQV